MDAWQHVELRGTNSPRTCHYFFLKICCFFSVCFGTCFNTPRWRPCSSATSTSFFSASTTQACPEQSDGVDATGITTPLLISPKPNNLLVTIARGTHLFPFRTESLSPVAPMVLHLNWCGRVGSRQVFLSKPLSSRIRALLFYGCTINEKGPFAGALWCGRYVVATL